MPALRRHGLHRPTAAGWQAALDGADAADRALLATWRRADLPLVAARQDGVAPGLVRLGLAAPARRRVTLALAPAQLREAAPFPAAAAIESLLPGAMRPAWRDVAGALAGARVFGSYGWQLLTGMAYVHAHSDIDLLRPVADAADADAVAARLAAAPAVLPRLDGELLFADGSAVAWREWQAWRAARSGEILVKRIDGVRLERDVDRIGR
jgi:phosphoribosyl-dephospho-CoA transferase